MSRYNRCVYMARLFFGCCSDCRNICCVAAVVKNSEALALECRSMLYVCVVDVMDDVFSVCIVRCGTVGARVWEVLVFRHANVVCLCLVCIMWQFAMLHSA